MFIGWVSDALSQDCSGGSLGPSFVCIGFRTRERKWRNLHRPEYLNLSLYISIALIFKRMCLFKKKEDKRNVINNTFMFISPSCHSKPVSLTFFSKHTKKSFQTTLTPIGFHCMDTKPLNNKMVNNWQNYIFWVNLSSKILSIQRIYYLKQRVVLQYTVFHWLLKCVLSYFCRTLVYYGALWISHIIQHTLYLPSLGCCLYLFNEKQLFGFWLLYTHIKSCFLSLSPYTVTQNAVARSLDSWAGCQISFWWL